MGFLGKWSFGSGFLGIELELKWYETQSPFVLSQEFVLSWVEVKGGGGVSGVVGSLGAFCIDSLIL